MISGHLLSGKLYIQKLDRDGKSNRETDSDIEGRKNQGEMKGVDVLSCLGQDIDEEVCLTSDQKVAGSSPAGCIKTFSKNQSTQKSDYLLRELLPDDLYVRETEDRYLTVSGSLLNSGKIS